MKKPYYIISKQLSPMVYFTRSATPKPGKFVDALKWAKETADYVNNKYDTKFNVYTQRYGEKPVGTVFWVSEYENVSKIEEIGNQLLEDQDYLKSLDGFASLFVEGTTYDSILDKH